jgi:hypothetical protein
MSQYLGGFLSATFNPMMDQKTSTVEYLVVAGGGRAIGDSGDPYSDGGSGIVIIKWS